MPSQKTSPLNYAVRFSQHFFFFFTKATNRILFLIKVTTTFFPRFIYVSIIKTFSCIKTKMKKKKKHQGTLFSTQRNPATWYQATHNYPIFPRQKTFFLCFLPRIFHGERSRVVGKLVAFLAAFWIYITPGNLQNPRSRIKEIYYESSRGGSIEIQKPSSKSGYIVIGRYEDCRIASFDFSGHEGLFDIELLIYKPS